MVPEASQPQGQEPWRQQGAILLESPVGGFSKVGILQAQASAHGPARLSSSLQLCSQHRSEVYKFRILSVEA